MLRNDFFFFNDTATTEIYTPFPTRRSSDLDGAQADEEHDCSVRAEPPSCHLSHVGERDPHRRGSAVPAQLPGDRKSTRLNSSHSQISYAVFCLKKKKEQHHLTFTQTSVSGD